MECMEAKALKSSFSSEIAVKSANPGGGNLDDIWCVSGGGVDDFSIDEFFDLPNEEEDDVVFDGLKDGVSSFEEEEEEEDDEEEEEEEKDSNCSGSISSSHEPVHDSAHFSTHLGIPDDDMQELELWSHFMDDSVPEPNIACPKPTMVTHNAKTGFGFVNRMEPYSKPANLVRVSYFPTAVPVKPRSKRSRTVVNRSWFSGSPPKTESSSSSSSPSSPVSTLLYSPPACEMGVFLAYGKPPAKKPKKRSTLPPSGANGDTGLNPAVQRRCTHCQVTKTPQWRAGPNGPKTLCNACGVRFKSGRLFPEYRPACSPTFSSEVHSNSHRKVLEMRRRKEMTEPFPVNGSINPLSSN